MLPSFEQENELHSVRKVPVAQEAWCGRELAMSGVSDYDMHCTVMNVESWWRVLGHPDNVFSTTVVRLSSLIAFYLELEYLGAQVQG